MALCQHAVYCGAREETSLRMYTNHHHHRRSSEVGVFSSRDLQLFFGTAFPKKDLSYGSLKSNSLVG